MSGASLENRRKEGVAGYTGAPMSARLAGEIVKPKDWPAFQRNCVVLFREELRDPNTKEFGRNGQGQGGIDLLGYREGDPSRAVGVQCRLIAKSLKQAKIMSDCRAALALGFGLREMIFATTAPNDVKSDQAAKAVERILRAEGHDLTVHVYGWEDLQTLIAIHEPAYHAFMPMIVATSRPVAIGSVDPQVVPGLNAIIADEVARLLGGTVIAAPAPGGPEGIGDESPALHARIDLLRDLVREGQGVLAEQRLIQLRDGPDARDAPWARYRIETNIAAALMDRGEEGEAALAYERALAIRPDDPNALANLSIARTMQGRPDEGMRIAREVLARPDRVEFAVSALLQAAARSDWAGEPEELVPDDLRGSAVAELAIGDFVRRRWLPGWERRVLALADTPDGGSHLSLLKALAVLSIAVDSRLHVIGGNDTVSDAQLDRAATDLLAHAKHLLKIGYSGRHDLMAHVSNAALLLRLANRREESETLLREGLKTLPGDEQLVRLLATNLIDADRRDDALQVLASGTEPETLLMKAQFGRSATASERLNQLKGMDEPTDSRIAGMRRRLMVEFALAARDDLAAKSVIEEMLRHPDDVIAARLLEVERESRGGLGVDAVQERLAAIRRDIGPDANPIDRFLVAEAMLKAGLEGEAADLIAAHVDLQSPRPATLLYLSALAESRRDEAYRAALAKASEAVTRHPDMLWLDARHAWNAGDIERSLADLDRFLADRPNEPRAVLMRIEVLLRLGRSRQVLEALDQPIEDLPWGSGEQPFRIVGLLSHFGLQDRAARHAYRLFLERRDKPRAWMTLSSITIREGQEQHGRLAGWTPTTVGADVAVDIEYDDGEGVFFIVEADPRLRSLDSESWEPDHALVRAVSGLGIGARFTAPDGREGRVAGLRHKIVARFHYVIAHYEKRFPEVFGFKSLRIDPDSPDGLSEMIAQLKERHDWVVAEQDQWLASGHPIDVLAARIGADTIDVVAGLAQQGIGIPAAAGVEEERVAAETAILANRRAGCVLNLATFWNAWRLGVLDDVAAICGPVAVPRSVVDRLNARRARIAATSAGSGGTLSYLDGGRILHSETPPEQMSALRDDVDAALAWIAANDAAQPLVMTDAVATTLRDQVKTGVTDMFDAMALSMLSQRMLVCDDLALRAIHTALGGGRSAWLHAVLASAHASGRIAGDTFTQQTVDLIQGGQTLLGVNGRMIAIGMEMDVLRNGRLGERAAALTGRLGGQRAEPVSHVFAVVEAMEQLWTTHSVRSVREAGTGLLLENLIRHRDDWRTMLSTIIAATTAYPPMSNYVREWARGHFLPGFR